MFDAVDDIGAYALLILVMLAFFALIAGLNLLWFGRYTRHGYRLFAKPDTPRPRYAFRTVRSTTIRGGSLIGFHNSSYPFATLEVDERWASVTTTFSRDVWMERSTVTEVAPVPGGIMFRSVDGRYDGMIFWCSAATVLGVFVRYGWPVPAPTAARPVHGTTSA
jgi:hypothetical protein